MSTSSNATHVKSMRLEVLIVGHGDGVLTKQVMQFDGCKHASIEHGENYIRVVLEQVERPKP